MMADGYPGRFPRHRLSYAKVVKSRRRAKGKVAFFTDGRGGVAVAEARDDLLTDCKYGGADNV